MTVYARNDLAYTFVSDAHKGCGQSHSRPVEHGSPAKVWHLDCPACEVYLRTDPNWSTTLSELPETYDEVLAREDFDKRGAFDRDAVMAMAMAKLAGVELPETLRRPLTGMAPHVAVIAGAVECDAGHPNEPGMKFCGECGIPLRAPAVRACPDGHETPAGTRFCGECGKPVAAPSAPEPEPEPAAIEPPAPVRRLEDMRAADLKRVARDRGVDDSGTRAQLLARLAAA